jgi:3D (Asp-Asp-Asp) domain-containing protein
MRRALTIAGLLLVGLLPDDARAANCATFRVTAYNVFAEGMNPTTRDGTPVWRLYEDPFVATDPDVIPLGRMVWIEGVGVRRAADTGTLVYGHRLDLAMDTTWEARQWGVRYLEACW